MEAFVQEFHEYDTVNDTSLEFSDAFDKLQPYLALFCVLGFLTNAVLLYILTKTNLHNASNVLILSLAISNLFVLCCMIFDTVTIASKSYPFSETVCKATETVNSAYSFVWPFTLLALIARRILVKPECGRTSKATIATIIVIWVTAFALSVPTMMFTRCVEFVGDVPTKVCVSQGLGHLIVENIVKFLIVVVVPLFAVGFFFFDVVTRNRHAHSEQNDISNLVLVLVVVYTLFNVPAMFEPFNMFFDVEYNSFRHGYIFARMCLYYAYPSVFPVALFCASGSFRQLFKRHVLFWCRSTNQEPVVGREVGMQPLVQPTLVPVTLTSG